MVADRLQHGELDEKTLKEIWGKIEMPTLGAWMAMAISLTKSKTKGTLIVPETEDFIAKTLKNLLHGKEKHRAPKNSLLAMRNRLAHGGGMTRKESEELIQIWQSPFENLFNSLDWLADISLVALDDNGNILQLSGLNNNTQISPNDEITAQITSFSSDSAVWLIRDQALLPLWPLALYSKPMAPAPDKAGDRYGEVDTPQVYVRADKLYLQYSPMGAEGFSQSHAGGETLQAFKQLFQLDKSKRLQAQKRFKVQDFNREIQNDARELVGREEELKTLKKTILESPQGLFWLTGTAGIGKSCLVGKLAVDLIDENQDENTLIFPYRFRSGDDTRCNRDAFANYVIERLQASDTIIEKSHIKTDGKSEQRLESALNNLQKDKRVIFILDGLDELINHDRKFAEDFPVKLRYPNVTWFCAGRPESDLIDAFRIGQAIDIFPDGLTPMSSKDIRSMIMEKIGPIRRKLVLNDKEKGDEVINPFIDLVTKRAEGLPLYVKYVINDVLSGNYSIDATANLPSSLHAYHEELLRRLGIGDLQAILTPLAATLAVAREPLAKHEIRTFLQLRKLLSEDDIAADELLEKALSAITAMLRIAPDPEAEEGFTLFHKSLRDYILKADSMKQNVEMSKQAFADAALTPEKNEITRNYLYRAGIDHLIDINQKDEAKNLLIELNYFGTLYQLGKEDFDIQRYWKLLSKTSPSNLYLNTFNDFIDRNSINERELSTLQNLVSLSQFSGWLDTTEYFAIKTREIYKTFLGSRHPDYLTITQKLASILRKKGDYEAAEPLYQEVLDERESALGSTDNTTLSSFNGLALLLSDKGDYEASELLYEKALKIREKALGRNHPDTITIINNLASLLYKKGQIKEAKGLLKDALKLNKATLGDNHPETLNNMNNLAVMLSDNDLDAAESLYREVLASRENIFGPTHPDSLLTMGNLADLLTQKGEFIEAENYYKLSLQGHERVLGNNHPNTLIVKNNFSHFLWEMNRPEAAMNLLEEVYQTHQALYGDSHPDTLTILNNLATLNSNNGNDDKAELLFLETLTKREKALGENHPDTLSTAYSLASIYKNKEEYENAEPLYRRYLDKMKATLGEKNNDTIIAAQNFAVLLRKCNQHEESLQTLRDITEKNRKNHNNPMLSSSLSALANGLSAINQHDAAIPYFYECIEIRRKLHSNGDQPDLLINTLNNYSKSLIKSGKENQANDILKEIELLLSDNHD